MTLNHLLTDIYAPLKGICGRTLELYGFTIAAFAEHLGHEPTLDDLEELTVARFIAARLRTRAASTAAKDRSQLRALWEFAARRRLLDRWPTIPLVRVPERIPEAWVTDDFKRLLASAAQERTSYDGIPAALYWRALLLLCYDTAERCGAVLPLTWSNVRGQMVLFRAEDRKGRRRDILREISEETQAALDAIRGNRGPDDRVFPWPCGRSYLWKRLGIILKRAGLPATRRDKFHKIRKTTASYYAAAGHSAQALLDHADPATTRKYLDPRIVRTTAAPDVIPRVS
jgi:integrase